MASKFKLPRDYDARRSDWWRGVPIGTAIAVGATALFILVYWLTK